MNLPWFGQVKPDFDYEICHAVRAMPNMESSGYGAHLFRLV
jgi:hypothetical protein